MAGRYEDALETLRQVGRIEETKVEAPQFLAAHPTSQSSTGRAQNGSDTKTDRQLFIDRYIKARLQ
jgi:hypothetical protein